MYVLPRDCDNLAMFFSSETRREERCQCVCLFDIRPLPCSILFLFIVQLFELVFDAVIFEDVRHSGIPGYKNCILVA